MIHSHGVKRLGQKAHRKDPEHVFPDIAGIMEAHNEAPGIDRERNAADDAHLRRVREKGDAAMVDDHEDQGKDLEPGRGGVARGNAGASRRRH